MKKAYIFVAGVLMLGALAACNPLGEFKTYPFARFEATIIDIEKEDVVEIPVSAYDADGHSGTVTFKVTNVDGEAANYTVEPASGVLNFNGNQTQNITVKVNKHEKTRFNIELTGATGDFTIGGGRNLTVNLLKYFPVNWEYIEGIFTAQDYDNGAKDGDPYQLAFKKVDDTHVQLINLWGGGTALDGTIKFDTEANTASMEFEPRQMVFDATAYGYGPMILIGYEGGWSWVPAKATATIKGISIGPWNMVITQGTYAGYLYGTSYTTECEK